MAGLGLAEASGHARLDPVTRLACRILEVPMAAVEVLDADVVRFPSRQGVSVSQLPRHEALSDLVTATGSTTVIADLREDPRAAGMGAVTEEGIRFFAGHPLRDVTGTAIGTLCLYDRQPRELDPEAMQTFLDLAAWAEHEMVSASDMAQASRVQASLLPAQPVLLPGWSVAGICLPALSVGGDFYDHVQTGDHVHVVLGDVMGKGAGAALLGAGVRAAIRNTNAAVAAGVDLGVTCTQVARRLLPDLERTGSFVTLFDAAIELDSGTVRYVDAGSGLAIIVRASGAVEHLRGSDPPYGMFDSDHWTEHQTRLEPGDRMVLLSDGVLDLLDDEERWVEAVGEFVHRMPDLPALVQGFTDLAGARTPLDDVTAVVVLRHEDGAP